MRNPKTPILCLVDAKSSGLSHVNMLLPKAPVQMPAITRHTMQCKEFVFSKEKNVESCRCSAFKAGS